MEPRHWRPVRGYEGFYEVCEFGHVKSLRTGRLLRPGKATMGYLTVALARQSKSRTHYLHRLVLEHFGPAQPTPQHICAHNNGVKTDNRISDLRWASRSENEADKLLHGQRRGCEHAYWAKLTREQIAEAASLRSKGLTYAQIAQRYGVTRTTISDALQGKTWKGLQ